MYDLKEIATFLILMVLFINLFFFKKTSSSFNVHESNHVEDKQSTLEEYWQAYDPADSNTLFFIAYNALTILLVPSLLIYGHFYDERIYFYSKYFLIFNECISTFCLFLMPTETIIKMMSYFKITTVLSVISTLFVLAFALIIGDLVLAAILFFGLFCFLNKVFA